MNQSLYFAMCAGLVMSPLFFLRSDRRLAAVPVVLGAVGFLAMVLPAATALGGDPFTPSRELSEAVADPDTARMPLTWAHAE